MEKKAAPPPPPAPFQDGGESPPRPPGPRHTGILTGIPLVLMSLVAIYILAPASLVALIIWLGLLFVLAFPLRYLVCARCPYYGQSCSTVMGRLVPYMFKKQSGSMKAGLWGDVIIGPALFLIPLPFAAGSSGWVMVIIWLFVVALVVGTLTRFGCTRCPLTFCPIGKAGRRIWGER